MEDLAKFEELKKFMKLVRARYAQQKCAADKRKIDWLFTFETWWKMWQESGKWEQRGRKAGEYCMARKGDIGPYSPENVDIVPNAVNSRDGNVGKKGPWLGKKMPVEAREKMRQAALQRAPQSDETRKKKSEANKKPWSESRRAAHKGAWNKGLKLTSR